MHAGGHRFDSDILHHKTVLSNFDDDDDTKGVGLEVHNLPIYTSTKPVLRDQTCTKFFDILESIEKLLDERVYSIDHMNFISPSYFGGLKAQWSGNKYNF